jgi:adenylate kinase family enzyme
VALASARRVLILGPSGAGKSTLAVEVGSRLGLPVIHLDAHYWQAGWIQSEREEFDARVMRLADQPSWVMDGNYSSTLEHRLQRTDHVIYMHASRWRCLANVARRWLTHRGRQRPDMAEGCPEKIDLEFVRWILWVQPPGLKVTLHRLRSCGKPLTEVRPGSSLRPLMTILEAGHG